MCVCRESPRPVALSFLKQSAEVDREVGEEGRGDGAGLDAAPVEGVMGRRGSSGECHPVKRRGWASRFRVV